MRPLSAAILGSLAKDGTGNPWAASEAAHRADTPPHRGAVPSPGGVEFGDILRLIPRSGRRATAVAAQGRASGPSAGSPRCRKIRWITDAWSISATRRRRHETPARQTSEAPHRPAAMRCGRGLLARRADGITGGRAAERSEGTLDPVEHRAENRPAMAGVAATACNRTPKPRTTAGAFSIYLAADFWPWPASTAARRDTSRPTASIRRFLSSVTICPQHLYPRRGRLAPQGRRSGSKNGCLARWTVLD